MNTIRCTVWEILEVDRSAPNDAITMAIRRLLKQHHPDAGGDPERFHQVQQVYEQAATS
jgi:DnaJ-class molecular chaperone